MAKCPKCGGELSPQENGLWTCAACGKTFSRKAAPVQDTIPADQTEAELRARLAAMEARQAETEGQLGGARANSGGGSKTTEFFKNKENILKIAIPGALLLIALIILLVCFCGLRGIYVNVENPNDYFSFGVGTFSTADGDDVIEGKWSRDGSVLTLMMEDEMFGEIELPVVFRKMSGYDMIEIDGSEYRRVSLIRIEDNMKKVNVRFDGNGGYTQGNSSYQLDLGGKIDEAPSVERTIGDYVFMGWYTSPNGWMDEDAEMFSSGIRLWEDVTYYANWRNDTDYTMTLPDVLEEETDGNEITYREGDDLLSVFMTALGWNELPEGVTGVSFVTSSGDAVDSDSAPATSVTAKVSIGDYIVIDGRLIYVSPSLTEFVFPDSVISIESGVFDSCSELTSVTIGANVASLRASDFSDELAALNVAEGNAVYHSAGNCVIDTENKILVLGCKNSVIPSDGSVTTIGSSAFAGCAELSSITIPESVTKIENNAFAGCTGLTEINWNAIAVEDFIEWDSNILDYNTISASVFSNAGTAGEGVMLTFGDSVTQIPAGLLYAPRNPYYVYIRPNIKSISIGENVAKIGAYAFFNCDGLTSITIPDSVTSIGRYAFRDCGGLTSVTIGNGVTSIGSYAFYDCDGLTSITIPDSVTSIGNYAFDDCTGLTEINWNAISVADFNYGDAFGNAGTAGDGIAVTFGESVEKIPAYLFYRNYSSYRPNVKSVIIGSNVTSIGTYAFYNCTGLTSVAIPDSVTSIGSSAFYGCIGLTSVTIGDSVASIGGSAFNGCSGIIEVVGDISYVDGWVIDAASDIKTALIRQGTRGIAASAFSGCDGLTSVTIPDSVTSIGSYAFRNCDGLTSVTIGNGVTSIGSSAFYGCTGLTSITIPDSVASIGDYAFRYCSGLTSVTFEETTGWYRTTSSTATSGTSLSSSSLSSPSTAARWLINTYYQYYWKRNV